MSHSVDVIVRTLADHSRSKLLFRALDSIQNQNGVTTRPIVVVNGQVFDEETLQALNNRAGILVHQEQQASVGGARTAGRKLVTAPFFAYLDDDDELIADSLAGPLEWLERHPECDVLISNGYFVKENGASSALIQIADHERLGQPALSLLQESWLHPGAFIGRTATISTSMLDPQWSNMEWTHLAFELCAEGKRLHFMDVPMMRYYDTPGSTSKLVKHHEAELELLEQVKHDARLAPEVRRAANRKYLRVLHNLSMKYWKQGDHQRAWRCHLGSLHLPYTLKYLLFSRKLVWPFGARGD